MVQRRIVILFAFTALIVLAAGCAARSTGEGSSLSYPSAAIAANHLGGTWRGSYWQVGGDGTAINGDWVLEIKDDATYTLASIRTSGGARGARNNDSGVVAADNSGITLKSSTGQWTRLSRKGDTLYGMMNSSWGAIHIMVEKAR